MARRKPSKPKILQEKPQFLGSILQEVQPQLSHVKDCLNFMLEKLMHFHSYHQTLDNKHADFTDAWLSWLFYDTNFYEKREFAGEVKPLCENKAAIHLANDEQEFWLSVDCYAEADLKWRIRLTEKARAKLASLKPQKREEVLTRCVLHAAGFIIPGKSIELLEVGPAAAMIAFVSSIGPQELLVFVCQLDRLPVLDQGKIRKYRYHHYLKLVALTTSKDAANKALAEYKNTIKGDPDRWLKPEKWRTKEVPDIQTFSDCVQLEDSIAMPKRYPELLLSRSEAWNITFDEAKQRWLTNEDEAILEAQELKAGSDLMNSKILSSLTDKNSCRGFIELLKTLPRFSLKLTEEELDLIGTPGNVLALGRSGTGKTTCAILRLFGCEVIFRYQCHKEKQKRGLLVSETKLRPSDIDSRCGLHSIFVTASPILTNEVRRYYGKLKSHLKNELRKNARTDSVQDQPAVSQEVDENFKLKANTMDQLKESDFPLFLTLRKLVFMLDGCLETPFFARTLDGKIIELSSSSQWHSEKQGVMMLSKKIKTKGRQQVVKDEKSDSDSVHLLSDSFISYDTLKTRQSYKGHVPQPQLKSMSFEIDFDYFVNHFWRKVSQKVQSEPIFIIVWTEISSTIKGSGDSHKFSDWHLPKQVYLDRRNKSSLLCLSEMKNIYEVFILYEAWKNSKGAYDFQDVVNNILNSLRFKNYSGAPLHFMMVDEVQDLTHATLTLLLKVTDHSLFFAGDTAQTIAKGVGFRFCDLRSLFHDPSLSHRAPAVRQLTVNFRSHGKILDLANSIISLIELMFPQTIDRLAKESNSICGPLPLIVNSQNIELFYRLLFGEAEKNPDASGIEFGCNQAIIVRSDQSKDEIKQILKSAIVFTIYEVKGLEFEDVFLYNFFADTPLDEKQWRIISRLSRTETRSNSSTFSLDASEADILTIQMSNFDPAKYSLLCSELKQLYVATTRPRKRLVIYDTDVEKRQHILNYWNQENLVYCLDEASSLQEWGKTFAQSSSVEDWRKQGFNYLNKGLYEQAAKCFANGHDELNQEIAQAHYIADKSSKNLQAAKNTIEEKRSMSERVLKEKRTALREIEISKNGFIEAAHIFQKHDLFKNAAKCFFSGEKYFEAAKLFEFLGDNREAAEAYEACGEFIKAAQLYELIGDYYGSLRNYEKLQDYESCLHVVNEFRQYMRKREKRKFVKYYINLATARQFPEGLQNIQHKCFVYIENAAQSGRDSKKEESKITQPQVEKEDFIIVSKSKKSNLNPTSHSFIPDAAYTPSRILSREDRLQYLSLIDSKESIKELTIKKTIFYISIFSTTFRTLTTEYSQAQAFKNMIEFWSYIEEIQIHQIEPQFISKLLEILTKRRLFKLHFSICNSYGLVGEVEQYILNLAKKHSNIDGIQTYSIKLKKLFTKQKAIAREGYNEINDLLNVTNPTLLDQLKVENTDSLYRPILLLGFRKIAARMCADEKNLISFFWTMSDFRSFRELWLRGRASTYQDIEANDFRWLNFCKPNSFEEAQACLVALNSVIWQFNLSNGLKKELVLEDQTKSEPNEIKETDLPRFPDYFGLNNALLHFNFSENKQFEKLDYAILQSANLILKDDSIDILIVVQKCDAFSVIMQLLSSFNHNRVLEDYVLTMEVEEFQRFALAVGKVLEMLNKFYNMKSLSPTDMILADAILSPLGIKVIQGSNATEIYNPTNNVLVNRNSIFIQKAVEAPNTKIIDIELNWAQVESSEMYKAVTELLLKNILDIFNQRINRFLCILKSLQLRRLGNLTISTYIVKTSACLLEEVTIINRIKEQHYETRINTLEVRKRELKQHLKILKTYDCLSTDQKIRKADYKDELNDIEYELYYLQPINVPSLEETLQGYMKYVCCSAPLITEKIGAKKVLDSKCKVKLDRIHYQTNLVEKKRETIQYLQMMDLINPDISSIDYYSFSVTQDPRLRKMIVLWVDAKSLYRENRFDKYSIKAVQFVESEMESINRKEFLTICRKVAFTLVLLNNNQVDTLIRLVKKMTIPHNFKPFLSEDIEDCFNLMLNILYKDTVNFSQGTNHLCIDKKVLAILLQLKGCYQISLRLWLLRLYRPSTLPYWEKCFEAEKQIYEAQLYFFNKISTTIEQGKPSDDQTEIRRTPRLVIGLPIIYAGVIDLNHSAISWTLKYIVNWVHLFCSPILEIFHLYNQIRQSAAHFEVYGYWFRKAEFKLYYYANEAMQTFSRIQFANLENLLRKH